MPMILTSYSVVKSLPPEGSEEWLALLPGWTGWKYHYGEGADSNMVITEYFSNTGERVKNIYYDDTHVVSDVSTGVLSGICMYTEVATSRIGDYWVITPCDSAIMSRLPRYYIKGNDLKQSFSLGLGGTAYYWAVAGVDSLTLE